MKFNFLLTMLALSLFFSCVQQSRAEEDLGYKPQPMELQNSVAGINKIDPLQNPRHKKARDILNRRVIDSKNKVVGDVKDIIIEANGRVNSILVNFDRLRLGSSVMLNYDILAISSVSNGYRIGFDAGQIKDMYPTFLSNIETASGGEDVDGQAKLYSLKDILGKDLYTSTGDRIGVLQDILFDQDGEMVRSAYLNINYQMINNKGIAVPLYILDFQEKNGVGRVILDERYVETILQYVKQG